MRDITGGWEIEVWNVQTIIHFNFILPKEGIVKFSGDNNDGKSIVRKFFYDAIGCQLHIKDNRYCLINDDQEFAKMVIRKPNKDELEIYAHRESSKTYYELRTSSHTAVKRYLKDKGLDTLIYDFGFHYLEKREFSLNVHPANTPNLFETTSSVCNKEVYDSATEDPNLNRAIENVENLVVELKDTINECSNKMAIEMSKINTSILVDELEEMRRVAVMQNLRRNIESIYPMEIVEIKKPPNIDNIKFLNVSNAKKSLEDLHMPSTEVNSILKQIKLIKSIPRLSDISDSMRDYIENKKARDEEVCVVCGRRIFDDACC